MKSTLRTTNLSFTEKHQRVLNQDVGICVPLALKEQNITKMCSSLNCFGDEKYKKPNAFESFQIKLGQL